MTQTQSNICVTGFLTGAVLAFALQGMVVGTIVSGGIIVITLVFAVVWW